jgi:hypothetical protein
MPVSPRALVDLILLGPAGDRRQLQDSPVLGDVWLKFATDPKPRIDLLITPHRDHAAGPVAKIVTKALRELDAPGYDKRIAKVAYLQGLIAARLSFRELLCAIVPRTYWWKDRKMEEKLLEATAEEVLLRNLDQVILWAKAEHDEERMKFAQRFAQFSAIDRYVALAGVILWASESKAAKRGLEDLSELDGPREMVKMLQGILAQIIDARIPADERGVIWLVSLNRKAMPALEKSVPAVKGDAARTLFKVRCDEIRWAVLDSGIDSSHEAFTAKPEEGKKKAGQSRVVAAYDFRDIRTIVSLDNEDIDEEGFEDRFPELFKRCTPAERTNAIRDLQRLADDAGNDRPIDWELVKRFIKVDPAVAPGGSHGTHVAGIIGARSVNGEPDGMCPDIKLLDFRVLGKTLEDTEFAIIAALQFIRYLNERSGFIAVHGANLSLSIRHDVRNFACGRTPICNECERLVDGGVVVVAAAGNLGYQSFETKEGGFDSYAAFSITDPGNADGVITVGATHRFWPHTYGVSFFSSRGPTGDGRLKPDIVAPGERIRSCLPTDEWGELDGTSMAAPHVSGAAAMLIARYSELSGQPRKIKRLLCESATDLGRERSFQGHGMLDVLRAFQQI